MLSSRSLISQYVTCIVDGGMADDDVDLHSLPMYHCAELDCFFGPDVYLGATSVILPGPTPSCCWRRSRASVRQVLLPADPGSRCFASRLRQPRPVLAAQGYYGASAMPARCCASCSDGYPGRALELLRADRDRPLATILRPDEQLSHAGSAGRPGINVETRLVDDDDERRGRRDRRDRPPQPAGDARLLPRRGEDLGGLSRRLVPLRDLGVMTRTATSRRRPQEGHDQVGWRERRQPRGRRGDLPAASLGGRRLRGPRSALGRGSSPRLWSPSPCRSERRDRARARRAVLANFKAPSGCSSPRRCRRTPAARSSSASCVSGTPIWRGPPDPAARG